ncbi:MAG TPA: M64 family metallopeptidase [Pyrinomonadaceae bacterium]|nr:M64 family metallopeptidase [Pyrinomonadaceae bacterium]
MSQAQMEDGGGEGGAGWGGGYLPPGGEEPPPPAAAPFETVVNNGSPQQRVDIAIVGDGYTSAELQKYRNDVNTFVGIMFNEDPYREYKRYFNVHRIDVTSLQSGADHPERGSFVNTAFDSTYNCSGIQRLICVDTTKVNNAVASSVPASQSDIKLVIVNDSEYGGAGYPNVAVASTHPAAVDVILHEIGHSFASLADEYDSSPPTCNNSVEPPEPNVTRQTFRSSIKWNHWIAPGTPVPTSSGAAGEPGLYQGAKYCTVGLYRPTPDSKMRSLFQPFYAINTEVLVRRYYNLVPPIESSQPAGSSVSLVRGQAQQFGVVTPGPLTHPVSVTWFVDGQQRGTGKFYAFNSITFGPGTHTVEALVQDATPWVRSDPNQLLNDVRSWTVFVSDSQPAQPNRIDEAQFFVRQHYHDFLFRVPDQSGLDFWTNNITSCGANPQCVEVKRIDTSAAFFLSIEFQETGYLVYRLYKASFNRMLRFSEFMSDTQTISHGVIVHAPNWEATLEANKQAVINEFVTRPAFLAQYPTGLTAAQYVDALNANTGGSLTQAERDALVTGLQNGSQTRATVLRSIAENSEFHRREFNRAFVLMQYFGYLRRNPDDAPDGNLDGFNFWLGKLNQFNGDYRAAEMVKAFISSPEYRARFGQ